MHRPVYETAAIRGAQKEFNYPNRTDKEDGPVSPNTGYGWGKCGFKFFRRGKTDRFPAIAIYR